MSLLSVPFAHRGLHDEIYPENSLGAFENAVNHKFGIELDVHLMKDGHLAVFHDDSLKRMTGKSGFVAWLTREELAEYKLENTNYSIPTLKAVLAVVNKKVPILIEIKVEKNSKKIAQTLINELKDYDGEVYLQSFNPFTLRHIYKLAPQYSRGQLSSFFKDTKLKFYEKFAIKHLLFNKFAHIDFVSYHASDCPNRFTKKCNKLPLLLWTIRSQEEFEEKKQICNNIIFENFIPKV